jgi:hypothetical protein
VGRDDHCRHKLGKFPKAGDFISACPTLVISGPWPFWEGRFVDTTFWMGILIGAVLSLATSIAGNIYTDQVQDFFQRRKRLRLSNKKARELATHRYISGLKNGDPTISTLFGIDQTLSNRYTIIGGIASVPILLSVLLPASIRSALPKYSVEVFAITLAVCAVFFLFMSMVSHLSIIHTKWKLLRFADYESQIRAKWGNDAI